MKTLIEKGGLITKIAEKSGRIKNIVKERACKNLIYFLGRNVVESGKHQRPSPLRQKSKLGSVGSLQTVDSYTNELELQFLMCLPVCTVDSKSESKPFDCNWVRFSFQFT